MLNNFRLILSSRSDFDEVIDWPIIKETEKALLVQTSGGETWLPKWKFKSRTFSNGSSLIKLLDEVTANNSNSLVRVWKAGAGKTEKSHKFQVAVTQEIPGYSTVEVKIKRRCFTLPVSQIKRIDGKWMAPLWLIQKKIHDDEKLSRSTWPGLVAVTAQIRAADLRITNEAEVRKESRIAKIAAEQAIAEEDRRRKAEARLILEAKVNADGEAAIAFCKRNYTLDDLRQGECNVYGWPSWPPYNYADISKIIDFAIQQPKYAAWKEKNQGKTLISPTQRTMKVREPDMVLENVHVEWANWIGSSNSKVKIENEADGCTVKFFGKKREITLPDGKVIVKMDGPNLLILKCDQT